MEKTEMNKKQIERLLKDTKNMILITDNGCGIEGMGICVLNLYTMLTSQLSENFSKEELQGAFDNAFKSPHELLETLKDMIDNIMNKMDKE